MTAWVSGGCGFWCGSLWWLGFFFFFGYDRCLKGLWVVVGSGVWVVVGLWLKWVVGCGSTKLHMASLSSLISHRGSTSWVWIGRLGSIDDGFETVDLLIGWVDHR